MPELALPALAYLGGALVAPFLRWPVLRSLLMLAVPVVALVLFANLPHATYAGFAFFGLPVGAMRLDALSYVFALVFSLAAFLSFLFAWHVRDRLEQVASLLYAGSAISAVFAADLLTLFVFWEGTAIASAFIVWARRTEGAWHTGLRYLAAQVTSGLLLLVGIVLRYQETGSIAFDHMELDSLGTWAIFLAFGIKCAFPLLNNWLQDAYPATTLTGSVTLSAFTTKLAVYALARGFAGTEILIYVGAVMTIVPVFFAAIENNLRRVLAYSLNNQLGFMVVGIGIGTPLALDGTVAHAFVHVIYKALLFMSVGAVMFRTGTAKASELGGLWKSMPLTMLFCVVGALSISSFPIFSGFIAKSLIVSASADAGHFAVWVVLVAASVGVLEHAGIKIPYSMFLAHDRGLKVKEAPLHMLIAMGLAAGLCIAIGRWPEPLYALLPYPVDYAPYTWDHVLSQLQLLLFAGFAFALLIRMRLYPLELRSINLDFDWFYRRLFPGIATIVAFHLRTAWAATLREIRYRLDRAFVTIYRMHGPEGILARTWPTGSTILWIAVLLGITLTLTYL